MSSTWEGQWHVLRFVGQMRPILGLLKLGMSLVRPVLGLLKLEMSLVRPVRPKGLKAHSF